MVAITDYSNTKPYPNRQNLDDKTIHSKTAALQTEDSRRGDGLAHTSEPHGRDDYVVQLKGQPSAAQSL